MVMVLVIIEPKQGVEVGKPTRRWVIEVAVIILALSSSLCH
jgi:hypothetical protein